MDKERFYILLILAKQEPDIKKFINRMHVLEWNLKNECHNPTDCKIILSTIHSSKGLEYDNVCMVDIYDGIFPSSRPDVIHRSKDRASIDREERRLFYVGITRAKNNLYFIRIKDKPSSFIDELFPEIRMT